MEQPTLSRQLGLYSATALVVANMIGTGIFTTTGFLAGDLGAPRWIMLSWVVGGICALLGALCYSELAINFPVSGGEYIYLSSAYGKGWGFVSGWVSLLAGFSGPIAAAALAFAAYLSFVFPGLQSSHFIASLLVLLLAWLNVFGIQRGALVQNVLTTLKFGGLVLFVVAALSFGKGNWANLAQPAMRWTSTPLAQQFAVSLFWVYVAYSGWNAAAYVAEEVRDPRRTLTRALLAGTLAVTGLYLLLNLVFVYAVPLASEKGVVAVGSLAASRLFGPATARLFSALMALGLLSTVNAMTIAGPRVYFAMARQGHFFRFAGRVHERWRTPANSILIQAVCTVLLVFTPFPALVVYIGFTLNSCAVLAVASLFWFRQRSGWERLPAVSFAWPLVPGLFIAVGLWITVQGFLLKPTISICTVATITSGWLLYQWQRSREGMTPDQVAS